MNQQRNQAATKLALKHYWQQAKQDRVQVLLATLIPSIGSTLVFYVPPLIVATALGKFAHSSHINIHDFSPYILLFVVLWGAGEMLWRVGIYFLILAEVRGTERLFNNAMDAMFKKDISFFHDNFAGSLTKKVTNYAWKYIDLMDTLIFNVFTAYIPILFVVVVLWHYSPYLVLVLIGLMTLTGFVIFPLIRRRQRLVAIRESANAKVSGYVADIIGNIDTVKAFANEKAEAEHHARNVRDLMDKSAVSWHYQNQKIDVLTSPLYVMTNAFGLLLSLYVANHSTLSLQVVFIAFSYYTTVTRTMWDFNHIYRSLESSVTEGAQFTELLLDEPTIADAKRAKSLRVAGGAISFRDVTFGYGGLDRPLLENFNLDIAAGEKVALVGHSGGGKTTVTRLLLRYMDISSGSISIDGQDIAQVSQHDLRSSIAYVPQEPAMFHRSLTDNIRYGKLNSSAKDVEKYADLAHADGFIRSLPDGYETLVGERGVKLSGGQRQRIAIARAMLKDSPILLLDEATSALDSESELLIQDALWKLMEGRTAIVIAHRLSTIQKMDRIVVMDQGHIAEQGSHKELLANGGIYAKLWSHQSGGFMED